MCRSSGRRNSSTGCSPSPRWPQQQRQRWHSGNKYFKKSKGGEGGSTGYKKATLKKGGKPQKPHKVASLTITRLLSGPSHPPKVMAPGSEGNVSKSAGITTPAHLPKVSGEHFVNTFACDALGGNGNEEFNDCNKTYKVYTDTDSDGKTEIITNLKCKLEGKAFEIEVKVDLRQTVYHWVISGACSCSYAVRMAHPRRRPWKQPWHSLRHMMVEYYKPMDGSLCQLRTSPEQRSFTL